MESTHEIETRRVNPMEYICLHTDDVDLADSFKIFFEGKYLIRFIPIRTDLGVHLASRDCRCQALIFDAVSPTEEDVQYLRQLKAEFPHLKIIISYVYFEEKRLTERLLASHVDDIIYKPYDFGEVDRRLQQLLDARNSSPSVQNGSSNNDGASHLPGYHR